MEKTVTASGFFAVRMLAARYPGEGVEADCRVNGLDWPAGKEALLAYAASWPQRGFEMRKQIPGNLGPAITTAIVGNLANNEVLCTAMLRKRKR